MQGIAQRSLQELPASGVSMTGKLGPGMQVSGLGNGDGGLTKALGSLSIANGPGRLSKLYLSVAKAARKEGELVVLF